MPPKSGPKQIAALLLAFTVAACGGEDHTRLDAAADSAQVTVEGFEYTQSADGERLLTGILYNPTQRSVENAQIQVSLYDEANQPVDSMIIPVRDISPGARKSFSRSVDSPFDVKGARPRSVLVW